MTEDNHSTEPDYGDVVYDLEPEILETVRILCPKCKTEILEDASKKERITCKECGRRIRVKQDMDHGLSSRFHEPLFLPKGSVRALVTLVMSITCWILIVFNYDIPGYLFSLLLTVIAYYFAFRKGTVKEVAAQPSDQPEKLSDKPLFLPKGVIRRVLIFGFIISSLFWLGRHGLAPIQYLEFFVVLAGLIIGYFFAKATADMKKDAKYELLNHIKAALVVFAAITAAGLILIHPQNTRLVYLTLFLCCYISFYFGSK